MFALGLNRWVSLYLLSMFVVNASKSFQGKLLHGEEAPIGSLSFMALLNHFDQHICHGFLISKEHILSAAHCLKEILNSGYPRFLNYYAKVGSLKKNLGEKCYFREVEIHENYRLESSIHINDIGIITLLKAVESCNTFPIRLSRTFTPNRIRGRIAGWELNSASEKLLNFANIQILQSGSSTCKDFRKILFNDDTRICGRLVKNAILEKTDAGGPLITSRKRGDEAMGIISVLPTTLQKGIHFTKVSKYYDWIEDVMLNRRINVGNRIVARFDKIPEINDNQTFCDFFNFGSQCPPL